MLLLLVIFLSGKAASMARNLGRFVSEARGQVEEFKGELLQPVSVSRSDKDRMHE